jgi:LysM repeat protein
MDPRTRRQLTRYGAPAAFLAAVTIAVLLIKSGLEPGTASQPTRTASTTRAAPTPTVTSKLVLTAAPPTATTSATTTAGTTSIAGAQYYIVKTGDTLGGIAAKYGTTVEQLMRLNPAVDPTALHPGDQIRVG